jgi:methanogenic corrinoid protein MtbC1
MRRLIQEGLAPAEAARAVAEAVPEAAPAAPLLQTLRADLEEALDAYDEAAAHASFDRALAAFDVDTVLGEVVLPCLRRMGEHWEAGRLTVAHEHFGSTLLRGRLLGLLQAGTVAAGPALLLACPQGELHDLGLLVLAVSASRRGWRPVFLGADTPARTLAEAADELRPAAVVLAVRGGLPRAEAAVYREVAGRHRLFVGGPGASDVANRIGAELLDGGPLEAAGALTDRGG